MTKTSEQQTQANTSIEASASTQTAEAAKHPTPAQASTEAPDANKASSAGEVSERSDADIFSPPPILGTWPRLYGLVFGVLLLQIAVYAWLTYTFS